MDKRKVASLVGIVAFLVGLVAFLVLPLSAANASKSALASSQSPAANLSREAHLPDRTVQISALNAAPAAQAGSEAIRFTVALTSTGTTGFQVDPTDFTLSAEGDIFGQTSPPTPAGALTGPVASHGSRSGGLTFVIPTAAFQRAAMLYRPLREHVVTSIPLSQAPASAPASTSGPVQGPTQASVSKTLQSPSLIPEVDHVVAATTSNTIEDTFTRPNQVGWGTSTNGDGVPNISWGMDGNGSLSNVTITSNTGSYGYPGAINQIGIASAGSATYNGGDALVEFRMSAVGHMTPYVSVNDCPDKSCYYGARMHTSQNKLELAKRLGGGTGILASVPFTPSANTLYWMRLDVSLGSGSDTLQAKIWADGSAEPGWMVSATDSSPLAANLVGTGGSWDQVGNGETIGYSCFAYATSGLASPCGSAGGGTPTPTPTPSSTPTPTPTTASTPTPTPSPTPMPSGTITEYPLAGGVGEPWGTATDAAGDVWFAEPGCDFAPTCSSTTPPGQLGELPAGSSAPTFYTLPNITGNQPIFVALDSVGNVWFTTPNNSMIGEFSPTTKQFVGQWAVTAGSGPWGLAIDNGKIWYTEHLVSSIGMFDPTSHTFRDFPTPTAGSNPYGIAASGNRIWFTENNSSVARIGVLKTNTNTIAEYPIRASVQNVPLTPHLIALDGQGHPWWTEGWVRAIGNLNVQQATAGTCGTTSGDCTGVSEAFLPAPPSTCNSTHVSGISVQGGGQLIWLSDSLSAQIGSYSPSTAAFTLHNLSCSAHPHDGVGLDSSSHVWWDEEFANALGMLAQ